MSRPKRQQPKRPISAAPEWAPVGICPACGKKIYKNKKAAKNAARIKHPYDSMSPYQCRSTSPKCPSPAPWHIGHLDEKIKNSEQSRVDMYVHGAGRFADERTCGYFDKNSGLSCSLPPRHKGTPHLAKNAIGDWMSIEERPVSTPASIFAQIHQASIAK